MDARVRLAVLERDKRCVVQQYKAHQCRTTYGFPHSTGDMERLTMEHVVDADKKSLSKKPPDDLEHMVAACGMANMTICHEAGWKEFAREYLVRANARL